MTIAITGVTGNLGGFVASQLAEAGVQTIHLARSPERAKVYPNANLMQASYENSPRVVAALQGVEVLFMVSAKEHPERLSQHLAFVDAAAQAGVRQIVYTSFYQASPASTFTLARDHAATEAYIREKGLAYTFLRDNFYLEFFLDLCLDNGEIRGPAGNGKVSAVSRKDVAAVAVEVLKNPQQWENQILNMTGPKELTMSDLTKRVSKTLGREIAYIPETVEEAYQSRKVWPAQDWEYDSWVSTYTAIQAGELAGVSSDIERVLGRPGHSLTDLLKDIDIKE